jgi:hypothetical protein
VINTWAVIYRESRGVIKEGLIYREGRGVIFTVAHLQGWERCDL